MRCGYSARAAVAWGCVTLIWTSLLWGANPADSKAAFVRVSPRDPRYFELTNGAPYIPIGFNLVPPPDVQEMQRVVQSMGDSRVNYCRIWLDQPPWGIEHARSGEYDPERARILDKFLSLCRERGIRVKMCIEFFRDVPAQRGRWSDKPLHHRDNGGSFTSMRDFLESERGREQFKAKLRWYAARYGNEPAVFAWELWNEMNAVRGDWDPWTREMLPELHRLFPKNLAVQSLGSFDTDRVREPYRRLCLLRDNDVAQVHRYLDLGAQLAECRGPVDVLAADAVGELRAFEAGKPIILTETGAVKPRHTGVSDLYAKDADGMLLHDMVFVPFFSGAAGTGHTWWWRQAIDQPKLWHHFARFAKAVDGLDPPAEAFEVIRPKHARLRIYALKGKHTFIAFCRDGSNTWESELMQGQKPAIIRGEAIDLSAYKLDLGQARIRVYDPCNDEWKTAANAAAKIALPDFSRSLILRVDGLAAAR